MQRFFLFFFATCLALVILLHGKSASAQTAVYVVEVSGDRVDAARIRAAVGRELSVVAVAPGDPEAAAATGTVVVAASAATRTLTVTFRKLESPVTRTVALPDDAARAEVAAVFLAGNLARDEAKELLGGMKKPGAAESAEPAAAPRVAPASASEVLADDDLRRLRIMIRENGLAARRRGRAFTIGALSYAGLAIPGGVALIAYAPSHARTWAVGSVLLGSGVGVAVAGLTSVVVTSNPDVVLQKKAAQIEAEGGTSAEILARIEAAWGEQVDEQRSARKGGAVLSIVVGAIAVGVGTTLELTLDRSSEAREFPAALFGVGAFDVGAGIYGLLMETPFETSYDVWRKQRRPIDASVARMRPSIGFAPARDGGAISLGFAF